MNVEEIQKRIEKGSVEEFKKQIKNGEFNLQEYRFAVHWAALHGRIDFLEYFLQKGLNFRQPGRKRLNVFYYAVQNNQVECLRYLNEQKVLENLISKADNTWGTVYLHASKYISFECLEYLLSLNLFDVNELGKNIQRNALQIISLTNKKDEERRRKSFRLVMKKGVDINHRDNEGKSVILNCFWKFLLMKDLFNSGKLINVEYRTRSGESVLNIALSHVKERGIVNENYFLSSLFLLCHWNEIIFSYRSSSILPTVLSNATIWKKEFSSLVLAQKHF